MVPCYCASNEKLKALIPDKGKKKVQFLDLDDTQVKNALAGGQRRSKHVEVWAINAFDEWRVCSGYSTDQ